MSDQKRNSNLRLFIYKVKASNPNPIFDRFCLGFYSTGLTIIKTFYISSIFYFPANSSDI